MRDVFRVIPLTVMLDAPIDLLLYLSATFFLGPAPAEKSDSKDETEWT